eukprot:6176189-Pleurochrysis_carterae.AAC.5
MATLVQMRKTNPTSLRPLRSTCFCTRVKRALGKLLLLKTPELYRYTFRSSRPEMPLPRCYFSLTAQQTAWVNGQRG